LISEDIAEEINTLKKKDGKDMIIWGGVRIVHTFLQLDLIDEYMIWIAPVMIGAGIPLFSFNSNTYRYHPMNLKLKSTTAFSNGVTLMSYCKI